jgi:hypothetical protein
LDAIDIFPIILKIIAPYENLSLPLMKLVKFSFAAALLILVGCDLVPSPENDVKKAVKEVLIDPSSAEFGVIFQGSGPYNFCGTVNAKNRMGGYAGESFFSFKGIQGTEYGVVVLHEDVAEDSDFRRLKLMSYEGSLFSEIAEKCELPKIWLDVCGKPFHKRSSGYCELMSNPRTLVDVLGRNF